MPISSDPNWALRTQSLGKRYRLGDVAGHGDAARAVRRLLTVPLRWALRVRQPVIEEVWALRDVDLEVARGEILGLVGPNGAGKSTLLKLLARITHPSTGRYATRGRVASLLEVGTGFHGELTGRENIYLSGTILGMRKREIDERLDAIVAFAGVGAFLDTPVKRYSSGMYVRLGFAVAAHLEAEILLVDEVLAVGDAEFRRKSLHAMESAATGGRTVVFVSHNMGMIQKLCTRAALIDRGRIVEDGAPDDIVQRYLHVAARPSYTATRRTGRPQIVSVEVRPRAEPERTVLAAGEELDLGIGYTLPEAVPGLVLAVTLLDQDGRALFTGTSAEHDVRLPSEGGDHDLRLTLGTSVLRPGDYHLGVSLFDAAEILLDRREPVVSFTLEPTAARAAADTHVKRGPLESPLRWPA